QPCHSANGKKRNVPGADTKSPGSQRVAEFVENHDAKQGDNENQSAGSVLPTVPQEEVTHSNPAKQNDKRVMNIHCDAGYLTYLPRPFHNCFGVKFRGKPDSG